jgi:hypothetical protein
LFFRVFFRFQCTAHWPQTFGLSKGLGVIVFAPRSSSSSSNSSSGSLPQIITTYSYTFYAGTCAVQQRITTLPVISPAPNGSGIAATRREYYDQYGNLGRLRSPRDCRGDAEIIDAACGLALARRHANAKPQAAKSGCFHSASSLARNWS